MQDRPDRAPPLNAPLLDSDLVRTFVAIAETGSFTRAAARVLRTPSAVSMQVKRLEEMLGAELFSREARNVSLTPAGERLLGYARRMLRLNEEAVAHFLAPPIEGSVSFGAPDDFGTRFLPNILSRFAATHPQVEVNVVMDASSDLMARIEAGTLDLTLVTSGCGFTTSEGETVITERLAWAGLRGGSAGRRSPLPLALASHGCCWRSNALDELDRAGLAYRVAYSCDHWVGQQAALLADLAVAPLPASLVQASLREVGPELGLPRLGSYAIKLVRGGRASEAIDALQCHVLASFEEVERALVSPPRPLAIGH